MGLTKAITVLNAYMRSHDNSRIDQRAQLVVALIYVVAVLTVPLVDPVTLVWMLCYPIFMSEAFGVGYWRIFCRSLWLLPLIICIGIFNPWLDREPMWQVGSIIISRGWVTFFSVVLRGLLAVQALLLLVATSGFNGFCRSLSKIGVPDILVTQLLMLYRYLGVMLEEALVMHRSRVSRGFGRKSYPLSMWGTFIGQLLMRSIRRSSRVNRAMLARGFDGTLSCNERMSRLKLLDWVYIVGWTGVILVIRFVDLSALISKL